MKLLTVLMVMFLLTIIATARDDALEISTPPIAQQQLTLADLPNDIFSLVLPMLSPLKIKALILTGNKKISGHIKYIVEQKVRPFKHKKDADPTTEDGVVHAIYSRLPFVEDDLSVYNLIMYADCLLGYELFNTPEIIDFLVMLKCEAACIIKLSGYCHKSHDCELDLKAAQDLLDPWINLNRSWALKRKVEGLFDGTTVDQKNPAAAQQLMVAHEGQLWTLEILFDGFTEGKYGFSVDILQAQYYFNKRLELYDVSVLYKPGIFHTLFNRAPSTQQIDFLDVCSNRGNPTALDMKYKGLLFEKYGYIKDPTKAKMLLKFWVDRGHPWALDMVYKHQKMNRKQNFLNHWLKLEHPWALKKSYDLLSDDKSKQKINLLKAGLQHDHVWAIEAIYSRWANIAVYPDQIPHEAEQEAKKSFFQAFCIKPF